MSVTKELIVVKDLHKNFGDLEVLKELIKQSIKEKLLVLLDLVVQENPTFLRCLNLLEKPTSGQIIF